MNFQNYAILCQKTIVEDTKRFKCRITTPSNTNDILPAILKKEVYTSTKIMKNRKTSEKENLILDILKEAKNKAMEAFNEMFTNCEASKECKNA